MCIYYEYISRHLNFLVIRSSFFFFFLFFWINTFSTGEVLYAFHICAYIGVKVWLDSKKNVYVSMYFLLFFKSKVQMNSKNTIVFFYPSWLLIFQKALSIGQISRLLTAFKLRNSALNYSWTKFQLKSATVWLIRNAQEKNKNTLNKFCFILAIFQWFLINFALGLTKCYGPSNTWFQYSVSIGSEPVLAPIASIRALKHNHFAHKNNSQNYSLDIYKFTVHGIQNKLWPFNLKT